MSRKSISSTLCYVISDQYQLLWFEEGNQNSNASLKLKTKTLNHPLTLISQVVASASNWELPSFHILTTFNHSRRHYQTNKKNHPEGMVLV